MATREALHKILDELIDTYVNNDYVTGRLRQNMECLLPAALDHDKNTQITRDGRKQQLHDEQLEFTTRFLHLNRYFYCPQTELFFRYDGLHFSIFREDDIHHQLLCTISEERALMPWKHKIKNNVLKQIKDLNPLLAIPESETIQFVLNNLCPFIFATKPSIF